ncbi:FtsK/SpoIIIE domain-containing protein [Streptacidiphilus sp. N1-12]|uniref:FtsK/SpoIIIE domain-containing protein n=2 Tax=Streptacidiphilus alkalitolerans TaxID=3342712 RepID=A0ABV6VB65_9ACTN
MNHHPIGDNDPERELFARLEAQLNSSAMGGEILDLGKARAARTTPHDLVQDSVYQPTTTPGHVPTVSPRRLSEGRAAWVRSSGRAVRTAVTHDHTRKAARLVARHGLFTLYGGGIVARRAWEGRTASRYERMMRTAEAAGQHDVAMEWEMRAAAFRSARHQRRMDLVMAPQRLAKSAVAGTLAGSGFLLLLGIALAIAEHNIAEVVAPTMTLIEVVRWIVVVASIVWGPLVAFGPWFAMLGLWNVGRKRGAAPAWAMPANQRSTDGEPITPSIVVTSLRDLGIAPLRTAIRDMGDAGAGMLGPIRIAGCGVEVDATLPSGVSTEEVLKRRRKLAENLGRHEHEVFLTIPQAARTVRMWIADSGALDEPIGPSALVTDPEMVADLHGGRAPWGQDLRGDLVLLSLWQRHLLITGLSNQGKTASLRALALWAAMDPSVELRIGDLKGVGDWAMFQGLATLLIQGPTDEDVIAITEMLEELVAEMERRIALLKASGATDGITPEMSRKDPRFRPIIAVVDEAQAAFMCPAKGEDGRPYGGTKATSRYFMAVRKIHNQGRALNITLWEGTQDPTNENLPKLVREGAHIRASLVVGTEEQARMAIGDKAVDGGAAPHKLRQGLDKGTVVVAGDGVKLAPGQAATTIRTNFIAGQDATAIADRIKSRRETVTTLTAVQDTVQVDPLADIAAVLDEGPRTRTQVVLLRLAQHNPGVYGQWAFPDLKQVLEACGAAPHKSDGQMVIARAKVLEALAQRTTDTANGDFE